MVQAKYRVAYFHQDGLITGSAISLRHFLSAIDQSVFEPVVILANEGPARGLYEQLGIPVYVYKSTPFWTFPGPRCFSRGMLKQLPAMLPDRKLKRFVLDTIKPDLIHINDKGAMQIGITMHKSGIPIIQHSRSSYHGINCPFTRFLSKHAIRKYADHIIAISEDETDGFENCRNLSVIYNTVDPLLVEAARKKRDTIRASFGISEQTILVGFAATVNVKKGAWTFMNLANSLKHKENLKFIVAGNASTKGYTLLEDGSIVRKSCHEYLMDFIEKNGLKEKVIVTGFRNDILDLIAGIDLLVVPNKNGVLGRQPIEAQAIGTATAAINGHSKMSKILVDGETGVLADDADQLIHKVNALVDNPAQLKHMGNRGTDYAALHFSPQNNMRKIESLYLSFLNADSRS